MRRNRSSSQDGQTNAAWWLIPLGLLGCLLIGLLVGKFQSPTLALMLLGMGLAVGWVAMVVARPEWALIIYTIAAVNLNSIDLPVPGGVRLSPDIVLTVLLIGGVLLRALAGRRPLASLPISAPYLIFLAMPIVTLLWSPTPVELIKGIFRFVGYYAIMWLIVDTIRTDGQVRRMVYALLLALIIPIATALVQAISGSGQVIWAGAVFNRVFGLAGGPFTLAYFLVLLIPLALVFFLDKPDEAGESHSAWQPPRWLLALLLAGAGVALVLTFIRGAWSALVITVLLLGILRGSVRFRQLLITIPVTAGAVLVLFSPVMDRITQVADPTSTFFGRIEVWKLAVDWITSNPLTFIAGLGMKAFEYYYVLQAGPTLAGLYWRRESFLIGNRAHNEILGFWMDVGLIGLVAMIVTLVMLIRTALHILRQSNRNPLRLFALAYIAGSAGMFIGAMGDNVFSQPSVAVYFWIMSGMIMAIDRYLLPERTPVTADQ